jgi:uncharacterized protein YqfB (UPF0267 family)
MKTVRCYRLLLMGDDGSKRLVDVIDVCEGCGMAKIRHPDGREECVPAAYIIPVSSDTAPITERAGDKHLKFAHRLPPSILAGDIDITWRIEDEHHIQPGDRIILTTNDDVPFATAYTLWTKYTTFGALTSEDKLGHERFESNEEMFATYSRYYGRPVGADTPAKVIKFRLLQCSARAEGNIKT